MQRPTSAARRDGFITRRLLLSLGLALATLVPAVIVPAYGDRIYLTMTGIAGEATAKGYEKSIAITSVQWGAGRAISSPIGGGGGREATEPSISELTVTKAVDSTSAKLFQSITGEGTPITTAKVAILSDSGIKRLEIELSNVLLSGFSQSASEGGANESLSLNFTAIKLTPYNADTGGVGTPVSWDLTKNTP